MLGRHGFMDLPKVNKSKLINDFSERNRYHDISTYKHSLVKMDRYLNANWVFNKRYIATQAPIPSTFADFWRMVYNNNCKVIVMLTKLVENSSLKAHNYLPDLGIPLIYDGLNIQLITSINIGDIKISYIDVNDMVVIHMHYLGWDDFDIPDKDSFKQLMLTVWNYNKLHTPIDSIFNGVQIEGPIVVHCSAGIGRTGVFIAIDYMLRKYLDSNKKKDVYDIVSRMRKARPYMVQTNEQYRFISEMFAKIVE